MGKIANMLSVLNWRVVAINPWQWRLANSAPPGAT
jgi:hypothetical protein